MKKLMDAAKLAYETAKDKMLEGRTPKFLGIEGMLALMHERIVSYNVTKRDSAILELAADSIVALMISMPDIDDSDITDIDDSFTAPLVTMPVEVEDEDEDVDGPRPKPQQKKKTKKMQNPLAQVEGDNIENLKERD